jgi:two-component system, NarL family, response regulator DevR
MSMDGRFSIFILSSNRLFRESVERTVRKKPYLDLKGAQSIQADSTHEIVSSGAEILVTDSLRFILETKEWRAQSTTERCRLKVVLVAMDDDKKHFLRAVKQGVLGYVLQDSPAIEVIDAIRAVGRGEAICPRHFTRVLFDCVASQSLDLPNARTRQQWDLTRREQQLIPMIGSGMTNKEIAAQFSLSEQTVKNHLHRILRKVGVARRLEAFEACQTESITL